MLGVAERFLSFSPLWLDEAQSLDIAGRPLSGVLDGLWTDGAPPLYYVLLHGWMTVFGTSDYAARTLSGVIGVAVIGLGYRVAAAWRGSRIDGVVLAVLLATNPWLIRYSQEARMYELVCLLVLLGVGAALVLVRRTTRQQAALACGGLAVVTGALLLTHYWSMFLVATVAGWCLWRVRRGQDRPTALLGLASMAGGVLLFLPWVPTLLHQLQHTGTPWAPSSNFGIVAGLPAEWYGGNGPAGRTLALLVWPLLLLGVAGSRAGNSAVAVRLRGFSGPGRILGGLAAGTMLLGFTVSMLARSGLTARYAAVVVPLAMLVLALGVRTLPRRYSVAALAVLAAGGLLAGVTVTRSVKSMSGLAASALNARAVPGDLVMLCPDQLGPAIVRRLHVRGVSFVSRPLQADPRVIDWTDYLARRDAQPVTSLVRRGVGTVRQGHALWLVDAEFGYPTHDLSCAELLVDLTAALGRPETVTPVAPAFFERYNVLRFTARR